MADDKKAPVYVSWVTFKNSIENLVQGVPNQIDRTTFPGMAGGVQNQMFTGLKFLGLTNDDDRPTRALHELCVPEEAQRKEKLKQILLDRYAPIFALDLTKATPQEVTDKMGEVYNISGDTKEKALRFFLGAVTYVGIPLSRFFKVPGAAGASNGSPRPKRRAAAKPKNQAQPEEKKNDAHTTTKSGGTFRIVQLSSGGTLTLAASVDLFQLSPTDRTFVFGLIDKLAEYEKEQGAAPQGGK